VIAHNNQSGYRVWMWGSDVLIQNSRNVEVSGNRIEVEKGTGVGLIQQNRGSGRFGPHLTVNNRIEGNTIVHLNTGSLNGAVADFDEAGLNNGGNVFDRNTYIVPDRNSPYWEFEDHEFIWRDLRRFGMERNGSLTVERRSRASMACAGEPLRPPASTKKPQKLSLLLR
jgi:hypothetical protein